MSVIQTHRQAVTLREVLNSKSVDVLLAKDLPAGLVSWKRDIPCATDAGRAAMAEWDEEQGEDLRRQILGWGCE